MAVYRMISGGLIGFADDYALLLSGGGCFVGTPHATNTGIMVTSMKSKSLVLPQGLVQYDSMASRNEHWQQYTSSLRAMSRLAECVGQSTRSRDVISYLLVDFTAYGTRGTEQILK